MKLQSIISAALVLFIFASCGTNKKVAEGKEAFTPEMQKIMEEYPDMVGFERRAIFPAKLTPEEEKSSKLEIIPGRVMYVDCNHYGLQGNMLKNNFENGNEYFLFNTNGQVFSTKMGCPDDSQTEKFVVGETVLTDYNSEKPIVVYANQNIQIKYSLWKSGDEKSVRQNGNGTLATEEALQNSLPFPEKANLVKHVLYLPELNSDEEINNKVEIIPGKNLNVDCNNHRMSGTLKAETLEGYGYDYYVFNSSGDVLSTRKACPDQKMEEKFISSDTKLLPYNSRLPIVVYTPVGFEVNYKIWETNGKMY